MESTNPIRLANLDWPWKYEDLAGVIILVSDEQFTRLANFSDQAIEKPAPWVDQPVSLRDFCRDLAASGGTKIHIAYDYFFGGSTRGLYPDSPEFQENLKKIHTVASQFGLGIEPSVLSPLELGLGYRALAGDSVGESGRWMQYGEGLRDPATGLYSVEVWKHIQWVNNKGPTPVTLVGVRVFAFREEPVPGTFFFSVNPQEIVELPAPQIEEYTGTRPVQYGAPEVAEDLNRQFRATRVRIHGEGPVPGAPDSARYHRVLVVLVYETVEMDYFSPAAAQFVSDLVQQYYDRGIELEGLYSDEMHIQQDWVYHHHLDYGQFTLRYVSPGLERAFAEQYGEQYGDFARWLVYFTCHQHYFMATHEPKLPAQHVFGPGKEDIAATLLFRRNYYHLLEKTVIRLMNSGREKLETLQGRPLDAYYHATWAESPTCDCWSVNGVQRDWAPAEHRQKYEYTPDFVWSNTVQQAAAACANYFAWNDFLTGGNNDTPEGGYADRNYYGRALACSLAALNRSPLASAGMWGMPPEVSERMLAVSEVFGALGHPAYRAVEDYAPRQVEALFLYPQDLAAVEERFGSWMVQYGYANLITADKLVEYGQVSADGWLEVRGPRLTGRYRAVCALYEPFPSAELLDLLRRFAESGGIVVWSSVPPLLRQDGSPAQAETLAELFGAELEPNEGGPLGLALPGRKVAFDGALASAAPMPILTDFVVDRVFPVRPLDGAEPVAYVRSGGSPRTRCIGVRKTYPGGGQALYLGFRPRDDQSASTGEEVRAWFEILKALGAYPGADNPTVLSRSTPYLVCAFPNGALAVAPHYRQHEESWPGGFFRDEGIDQQAMQANPLPDEDVIQLDGISIAGQRVTYAGRHCLTWRAEGEMLAAFAGQDCTGITLGERAYRWSAQPVSVAWHPLPPDSSADGYRPLYRIWCDGSGTLRLPIDLKNHVHLELWKGAHIPSGRLRKRGPGAARTSVGFGVQKVPFILEGGELVLEITEDIQECWLYLAECE